MPFSKLMLIDPLLRAIHAEGYTQPTDIQKMAIPEILMGQDVLGCAQTGTGKTAAFALPTLQRIAEANPELAKLHHANTEKHHHKQAHHRTIRALVLAPTRELAVQVHESFQIYGRKLGLRHTVVYGGVKQGRQVQALRKGVDILVATPGRLQDLMGQGEISLDHIEMFVLDEADRMLDMGFIDDIKRIMTFMPERRQNLMFSATMPKEIRKLADSILHEPIEIQAGPKRDVTAITVEQYLYQVTPEKKMPLLHHLLMNEPITRAIVFTRTKHRADKVARNLSKLDIPAAAIHGDKSQNARQRALNDFKSGKIVVLVASDLAARGIDVEEVSHVINYELPDDPETYVHRIGRTGRAGSDGVAMSFCSKDQRKSLRAIQRLIGKQIELMNHPEMDGPAIKKPKKDHPLASDQDKQKEQGGGERPFKKPFKKKRRKKAPSQGKHQSQGQPQTGGSQASSKPKPKPKAQSKPKPQGSGGSKPYASEDQGGGSSRQGQQGGQKNRRAGGKPGGKPSGKPGGKPGGPRKKTAKRGGTPKGKGGNRGPGGKPGGPKPGGRPGGGGRRKKRY